MKLSIGTVRPCTVPTPKCVTAAVKPITQTPKSAKLGKRWMEYQGARNWEGLLDPLDDNLRDEILRYGHFVGATYNAFDFDPSSPTYANCRFPKHSLFHRCGLPGTGYRVTKNLHATSGIKLPRWISKAPNWVSNQTSWIGYVAVCQDEEEIARLGRRDVVVAYRGTATCHEWLENLRTTLTHLPNVGLDGRTEAEPQPEPMVARGFLSLFTSGTAERRSLREEVRDEIGRLLQSYGDEPLSLTITGHSLGAALATLTAYDITTTFRNAPLVTVISFGAPRVGNRGFRCHVEKCGSKVLRIVNSDDLVTKVPGFVIDEDEDDDVSSKCKGQDKDAINVAGLPSWLQRHVENTLCQTQWVYADVGRELRVSSRDSPYLTGPTTNLATSHELDTYLHLVNGFLSSKCPFRKTAKKMFGRRGAEKASVLR
ncbi:phospholipase A(1) DAD1, chloroplastic-like [Telopea speciosissima]|uniref:phospholipase A(1) DAD1, chloroplastic-like n=1 Tax=Telopea speciosissima TaxID=54955 RepID=UPI001CC7EE88|nr:phospholipase A(1) DAD1, chloroplastic-like [Telopea speciosissima]